MTKTQQFFLTLAMLLSITQVIHCQPDDLMDDEMDDMYIEDEDMIMQSEDDFEDKTEEPKLEVKERPVYKPPKAEKSAHFSEAFEKTDGIGKRWIKSRAKKDGADDAIAKYDGEWEIEEPEDNPLQGDLGLVLKSRAKHHAIAAKLDKVFDFTGSQIVVQYEVKFQSGQDCGGAYVKLLSDDKKLELSKFTDKTPYTIMFGPDKCGNDHKLHFIFRHKNPKTGSFEEKHTKVPTNSIQSLFTDKKTHLFTLVVSSDNSFEIYADQDMIHSGNLLEDMEPPVNPPKEIDDTHDKKPENWDEREKIPDPDATKPDDWDENEPEMITDEDAVKPDGWLDDEEELTPDPDAEKPDDWDEDMDGEWEPPMTSNPACESAPGCGKWEPPQIKNPKYKGKWRAPLIDNPSYSGKWKPRKIANPDYFDDQHPYKMTPIAAVGLELWSMSDNIMFDNFIITDDKNIADKWADESWGLKHFQEMSGGPSSRSVVQAVLDAINERPWLWAVFIVVIILPIVLFIAYCCMPSSSAKQDDITARMKKTDEPSPDDAPKEEQEAEKEEEEGEDEEEEEEDAEEEKKEEVKEEKASGDAKPASPKKSGKASKKDLETEEGDEADVEEEESKDESPKTRTSPRKRRARKE